MFADGHVQSRMRPLSIRLETETFGRQGQQPPQLGACRMALEETALKVSMRTRGVNGLFGGQPAEENRQHSAGRAVEAIGQ
jgi:hypothetical protein